ncbi:hypothetical protein [Pedobacter sp. GR22-10]|uniref:hypothetical protein n=1 Tax=Pedobacter sp. GR22-10 TaxID=2994472 RepID=UPI002246A998|nr:hypothetical protein [Pedobacter sp. GR22-10]MCX2430627.1 hypothetical protein [Pedobacter sp. GR22-10]
MKILCFLVIYVSANCVYAQNSQGPRLTALADNGTAVNDIWTLQANPAGITFLNHPAVSLNYIKHLLSDEISTQAFVAVIPFKNNYAGISFQRYGFASYHESKIGFAYAKKFGQKLSLALNGNYHQLKIEDYGASTAYTIDAGVLYQFNQHFSIGAFSSNASRQQYSASLRSAKIPASFNIGASYLASKKVLIATTVSKITDQPIDVRIGIEYQLFDLLSLRGGLSTKPFKQYAGFGINCKKFVLDMATTYEASLGYAPQIAISYVF